MSMNVTFGIEDYELLPKERELFERYAKIVQWGRREPVNFIQDFIGLQLTDFQKWILSQLWVCRNGVVLASRNTGRILPECVATRI